MARQPEGTGPKIGTTAIIWGFATGMLAICIPIVGMTQSGVILPLAVVLGASVGTVVVWQSPTKRSRAISDLTNSVQLLNERIVTLEAICSSGESDIQNRLKQLELRDKI